MTNAHDESPRSAADLFGRIDDDLDRLAQLVVGLDMAATDVADEPEEGGLRAIIGVVEEKIAALKTAMQEARETLEREQPERKSK